MKHKIIYTNDYALIVSDEQAKENDWGYIPFQGGEVKLVHKFFASDWRKIIAYKPLNDIPILKGIPLLPEFSQPKRPKYFEMEVYFYDNPVYNTYPKTKLISKCKTELVGEYSYE
jgi:hypothetical protein